MSHKQISKKRKNSCQKFRLWQFLLIILIITFLPISCSISGGKPTTSIEVDNIESDSNTFSNTEDPGVPLQSTTEQIETPSSTDNTHLDLTGVSLFPAATVENQKIKYGYIDITGKFVISPKFSFATNFFDEVAFVRLEGDGFWHLINKYGEFVSDAKISCERCEFSDGLAEARSIDSGLFGYIDSTGIFVIPPQFDKVEKFHNGYAIVSLKEGGKTYIDKSGKIITPPDNFLYMSDFDSGAASLSIKPAIHDNPAYGVINSSGEIIVPFSFAQILEFSDGMAAARPKDSLAWGYMDVNGNIFIEPKFDYAGTFSEGLAVVTQGYNGKCGYIDKSGQQVIDLQYSSCRPFSEELAWVKTDGFWFTIDHDGNQVFNLGFDVDDIKSFNEGFARFAINSSGYGFVNLKGEVVIPPDFLGITSEVYNFQNGLLGFTNYNFSDGKMTQGYINQMGKIVYQIEITN